MFVLSGVSGVMYDFFLYCGAKSTRFGDCSARSSVLELCETIPRHQNYKLFFDNWFCTLALCLKLKGMGILTTATVRKDRIGKCPLESTVQMTKSGRGSLDYRVDLNTGLCVVTLLDNGEVHMVSTVRYGRSVTEVQRWDKKKNTHISISCPSIVKSYNSSMGGVDLSDMFLALFRTKINIKRWYVKLFFHLVGIAEVNGWLLYKRSSEQNKGPKHDATFRVH